MAQGVTLGPERTSADAAVATFTFFFAKAPHRRVKKSLWSYCVSPFYGGAIARSVQFLVLRLRGVQDRYIGVSILPQCQEILIVLTEKSEYFIPY
jgi:hypothetical protein